MFDWLFEGRPTVYVVLGVVAFLFLHLWVRSRQRLQLIIAGLALVMIPVYYLLDRFVETDRESIEATVRRMTGSVAEKNLDVAFRHISDRFVTPRGRTKAEFRQLAEGEMQSGRVTGVVVWGFRFPERPDRNRENKVSFEFKVRGNLGGREDVPAVCEAVFVCESPGIWRMLRCRILDSFHDNEEIPLEF